MSLTLSPPTQTPRQPLGLLLFLAVAGVGLPAFTLGFELVTRAAASDLFDPLPTPLHVLLVALVPLANAWLLWAISRLRLRVHPVLARLHGLAMGLSLLYALLFLPITPLAVIAIAFMGLGLLPLAPLLSLLAAWGARRWVQRRLREQGQPPLPGFGWSVLLALLVLVAADLPSTVTRLGLQAATREVPSERARGVRWLRAVGDEDLLLRLCYARTGLSTDLVGGLLTLSDPPGPEDVRRVFFQVTGEPFNARPAPLLRTLRETWQGMDGDRGSAQVGQQVDGLQLVASQLDGSLDADAALGYLEWTLVLRNDSTQQQEGRTQIALPPGGVVSRLTLWIDGEEHEAAFGGRAQTRGAYERVVRRQRDPVLVTTAGPDRVLLQAFPVPPDGGEMKMRLGITVPLALRDTTTGRLQLPVLRERNFALAPGPLHQIALSAERPLQGPAPWRSRQTAQGTHRLQARLDEAQANGPAGTVSLAREPALTTTWSADSVTAGPPFAVQQLRTVVAPPVQRVALVVDGSAAMAQVAPLLAQALQDSEGERELGVAERAPQSAVCKAQSTAVAQATARIGNAAGGDLGCQGGHDRFPLTLSAVGELALFLAAGDGEMPPAVVGAPAAAQALRTHRFIGGQDNLAALERAWDWIAPASSGTVLWVHGPQPWLVSSAEPLRLRMSSADGQHTLQALEVVPGPDRVMAALEGVSALAPPLRGDGSAAALRDALARWRTGATLTVAERERRERLDGLAADAVKTSPHLARLAVAQQVQALLAQPGPGHLREATALAVAHQLVTPVSGAVVLETARQFEEAGLQPVDSGSVPSVPEPEEWMLMAVVAFLLLRVWRSRRAPAGGAGAPA